MNVEYEVPRKSEDKPLNYRKKNIIAEIVVFLLLSSRRYRQVTATPISRKISNYQRLHQFLLTYYDQRRIKIAELSSLFEHMDVMEHEAVQNEKIKPSQG